MTLIVLKAFKDEESVYRQLCDSINMFWDEKGNPTKSQSYAFVIDGESLSHALQDSCRALLLELACRCKAVICCRVSPLQKAQVVSMVRKGLVRLLLLFTL